MRKGLLLVVIYFKLQQVCAQDNYEIQVYASPTTAKGTTMLELHSNFTFVGEKQVIEDVTPSYHALHETLEITQGITGNFEIGFYLFTNYTPGHGYKVVGSHIRPRIAVPASWNWPVGVSLSTEFGYQRRQYSVETWSVEIRPIIDKQWRNLYIAVNPTFGIPVKSDTSTHAPSFEPNIKASWNFNKLAFGIEYYGDLGTINNIPVFSHQVHGIFFVADLNVDPKWEINFGPGFGLTKSTDGFIFKLIVGRRLNWNRNQTRLR